MLRKTGNGSVAGSSLSQMVGGLTGGTVDRRAFLRRSGLTAGGLAAAAGLSSGLLTKADAQTAAAAGAGEIVRKKTVCTHCSVGCTVIAEVQDGVWLGQEPAFDSPFNLGSHCAKGAAIRELGHGDRRTKYPMKLVAGKWQRMGWDEAIEEIGGKLLQIRESAGPELGLLAWIGQVQQRTGLPVAQVRRVLGQQQRRPPGAHLPFDHRRRRSQYLGLRRDDQLLQRHPQLQADLSDRRQPGRGAPRLAPPPAEVQGGEQRSVHRVRSPVHAHRRQGRRVCAHPLRH